MFIARRVSYRTPRLTPTTSKAWLPQHRQVSYEAWEKLGTVPSDSIEIIDGKPCRTRDNGGRPLPLPPMLDTAYEAARAQITKAKEAPDARDKTPFQHELEHNVFAKALLDPVRRCIITGARLPRHFLQPFECYMEESTVEPQEEPRIRAKPRMIDDPRHQNALGRFAYVALDVRVLRKVAQKTGRRHMEHLLIMNMQARAESKLNRKLQKHDKARRILDDKYIEAILELLTKRVQTLVDSIMVEENVIGIGISDGSDPQIGLYITYGAPPRAESLTSGVMHYAWDGLPSCGVFSGSSMTEGSCTFGLKSTRQVEKLEIALNRLFAYRQSQQASDEEAKAAAQAASERWQARRAAEMSSPST